jgi:hypothetical protein
VSLKNEQLSLGTYFRFIASLLVTQKMAVLSAVAFNVATTKQQLICGAEPKTADLAKNFWKMK